MVVVIGASGPTGLRLIEHLVAAGQRVRALIRPQSPWPGPLPALVRLHRVDPTRHSDLTHLLEDAQHVVYLAGSRPAFTASASRLMVDYGGFMNCLEAAQRVRLAGSLLYVGAERVPPRSLADRVADLKRARWCVYKQACEHELLTSGLRYLLLRAAVLTDEPVGALRVRLTQRPAGDEAALPVPRTMLAALLAGALVHGHRPCSSAAIRAGGSGLPLKQAITRLRDIPPDRLDRNDPEFSTDPLWRQAQRTRASPTMLEDVTTETRG